VETSFSILTPNFNQGQFLGKAINSVQQQDVSGVQHIVIDGGSTDESVDVLQANDDKLGYWVSEPDDGQAHALSKALTHATGKYVGWINADEYYEPNILGQVQAAFESDPDVVLVYGNVRRVDPNGNEIRVNRQWRFDYDICQIQTPIIINCGAFFRRDRLIECGGFDPSWQYLMDWEMYIRFMRDGQKAKRLKQTLSNFTMHEASKTATSQPGFEEEILRLRRREFPDWTDEQIEAHKKRQHQRMVTHMLMDGVLFEKAYFKLVKQRQYAQYFGDAGARLPVISRVIDLVVPVKDADGIGTPKTTGSTSGQSTAGLSKPQTAGVK